jgi:hypothetical protein
MKDLPEELWLRTFRSIGIRGVCRTLAALCLVCKRFYRIAQPILYEFPEFSFVFDPKLFRTLSERRDLVQYATALDLEDAAERGVNPFLNDALRPVLESIFPNNFAESLRREIEDETDIPYIAASLALFPNLAELHLKVPFDMSLLLEFFQMAAQPRAASPGQGTNQGRTSQDIRFLAKLKELRLSHWDTEGSLLMWEVVDIFSHPSLETLTGHANEFAGRIPSKWASQRLAINHVDLEWSLMDAEGLESLLILCPQLSTLVVEWGPATVGDNEMDFNAMGDALRKHGTNLKILDFDPRESFNVECGDTIGRIGSLRELMQLRKLRITEEMLLGKEGSDLDNGEDSAEAAASLPPLKLEDVLPEGLEDYVFYD